MAEQPFPDRLKGLAAERGTSVERVAHEAWDMETAGTSPANLRKVLAGTRPLNRALVERLAAALEVEPAVFVEYRLAVARSRLDEREVGLDAAVANLALVEDRLLSDEAGSTWPRR